MQEKLLRVGTTYVPVHNPMESANWYTEKLGAEISYLDEEKAIINLADQSFFLVKSQPDVRSNFIDSKGETRFCLTFEVDGVNALYALYETFNKIGVQTGEIEDRGHSGENFVFSDLDGNLFDVWSELSPAFKRMKDSVNARLKK